MTPLAGPGTIASLRAMIAALRGRLEEMERLCREAAELVERLEGASPAASAAADGAEDPRALAEREAVLLVAITLRGGTLEASALDDLAAGFGVQPPDLERLFAGEEPYLARRGAAARLTERGLEAAAGSRAGLTEELLRAATDL